MCFVILFEISYAPEKVIQLLVYLRKIKVKKSEYTLLFLLFSKWVLLYVFERRNIDTNIIMEWVSEKRGMLSSDQIYS